MGYGVTETSEKLLEQKNFMTDRWEELHNWRSEISIDKSLFRKNINYSMQKKITARNVFAGHTYNHN